MPVVMEMHWPEFTAEQYEEARRRVDWEVDVPQGAIFHVAWVGEDGFHVNDVWESPEDFNAFVENRLQPALAELGVASEPKVKITPALGVFKP